MPDPVARLIEIQQGQPGRVYELGLGKHTLGRMPGLELVLDHADVSRRHAELEVSHDGATVRDLDSKNGVVVDGRKVSEAALDDGSRLAFGELNLLFEHPGARVSRVLQLSGEATIRRPREANLALTPTPKRQPGLLGPLLAATLFVVALVLFLVLG